MGRAWAALAAHGPPAAAASLLAAPPGSVLAGLRPELLLRPFSVVDEYAAQDSEF